MIAHRLNTVKNCDSIFLVADGKVLDHGTYDHLMMNNLQFKIMAEGVS